MSLPSEVLDQTIKYYDINAEDFYRETVSVDMSELYSPFIALMPEKGKILDVGCGSGRDSLYFIKKGLDVTAFDASAELVIRATRLTKLKILQMKFDQVKWINRFDGVWACASLLHLPKTELVEVLGKLLRCLKKGGILYASFKEGEGEKTENDRYFSYYSVTDLERILGKFESTQIDNCWVSSDVRKERVNQNWINFLIKKR